jgi:hypothetical protein
MIGYKPLKVGDIGGISVLVVPPVNPKPADIGDWVTLTGYDRGDIIENAAGVLYWCTVAGTTGAAEPTHTDGDAADGTVTCPVDCRSGAGRAITRPSRPCS